MYFLLYLKYDIPYTFYVQDIHFMSNKYTEMKCNKNPHEFLPSNSIDNFSEIWS